MNKQGRIKIVVILVLAMLALLAVFYFVANSKKPDDLVRLSATESVIQRDLGINYPQTPKAVVRYYAELSQCMYDPGNSDEEVEAIAKQSRLLFDEKLKAQQSDAQYLASLKSAIAGFINENRRIVSFTISPSREVVYKTLDIGDVATLYCTYTMQKGSVSYSDAEHFLLRRDSTGRWKILGWQSASLDEAPVDNGSDEDEEENAVYVDSTKQLENAETQENPGDKKTDGAKTEAPKANIEVPKVEIPKVEVKVPDVK